MKLLETRIPDVLLLEPKVFGDERGFFMETWRESAFNEIAGTDVHFVQDNHSSSTRGVLRGLHYQLQNPQGKLVRVISGEVYDIAVDIRRDSATFGQYAGEVLSAENKRLLWVPPGFAHGFLVLSEYAEFVYKCSNYYAPAHERCIIWNDPDLAIDWPLEGEPRLSEKDLAGKRLSEAELF